MAAGIIKVIPASGHLQILVGSGNTQYPSIKVLNPNDGVVYVARNRECLGTDYGSWDWKIPSQSYGMLPGPFETAGVYYLDQSGAGRQGEITIYPSMQRLDDPLFLAIGRAIQAQVTTLDITEGTQPPAPAAGIDRLWADNLGRVYALQSDGTLRELAPLFGSSGNGSGLLQVNGVIRSTGSNPQPTTGAGPTIYWDSLESIFISYDYTASQYKDLYIDAQNLYLRSHGGVVIPNLAFYTAQLASLTNLTAGVWNDTVGPSISLPAGTYLIFANGDVNDTSGASQTVMMRLVNGTAASEYARAAMTVSANGQSDLSFHSIFTLATDTYKLSYLPVSGIAQANGGVFSKLTAVRIA